ncbi:MAG: NADH-quinone oxidoreductase subunit N [Acidobacteria bacterium]|nr:NADH-quinone oxidoreductase subunit N [Acidobacteriota bacterium]
MTYADLIAVLPEAVLTVAGIVVMLLGTLRQPHSDRWAGSFALLGLLGTAIAVLVQRQHPGTAFGGMIQVDRFGVFFHLLFLLIAALVALMSSSYLRREKLPAAEYYALLLFGTAGMGLMASANELIVAFIGLEISSLSSYVLVGFRRRVAASSEAALKYFLLGSFATAFLLYGIALMFGATGTTNLSGIREVLGGQTPISAAGPQASGLSGWLPAQSAQLVLPEPFPTALLSLSMALIFVGLAFKVSAAPFQVWTPDVYQGAPTPITAFLSTGPKAAAFALFLRVFMGALEGSSPLWWGLLWTCGLLSMFLGNLAALWQSNLKRLLAYSSIAHAGYMLVAFTAHSSDGVAAVLFYLAAYTFMNIGAFAVVSHLGGAGERYVAIDDYAGLGYRSPWLAAALSIFLLSLIGIPLTGGFFGKFFVFRAALRADLLWLTVLGVLNSAVAAYYYLRILVAMYMSPPGGTVVAERVNPTVSFVLAVCVIGTLLLGVFPSPVWSFALRAAQWLQPGL